MFFSRLILLVKGHCVKRLDDKLLFLVVMVTYIEFVNRCILLNLLTQEKDISTFTEVIEALHKLEIFTETLQNMFPALSVINIFVRVC